MLSPMKVEYSGVLEKMGTSLQVPVAYQLILGEVSHSLTEVLGKEIQVSFSGNIYCLHCGKKTKKSFGGGHCFHHFSTLAQDDICIVKPELCHYRHGTCREPGWGQKHCLQPHVVYLANSSGLKIGMTRAEQIPTRWIDQGAIQAIPLYHVTERWHAGLIEVLLAKHYPDKTNWRKMLSSGGESLPLTELRHEIHLKFADDLNRMVSEIEGFSFIEAKEEMTSISYPVANYPVKVSSLSFDKTPEISGTLLGIKGQYLILNNGVLNLRKHAGYHIQFSYETGE